MPGPMFSLWSSNQEELKNIEQSSQINNNNITNVKKNDTKEFTSIIDNSYVPVVNGTFSLNIINDNYINSLIEKKEFEACLMASDDVTGRMNSLSSVKVVDDYIDTDMPDKSSTHFYDKKETDNIFFNENIIGSVDEIYDPAYVEPFIQEKRKNHGFPAKSRAWEKFRDIGSNESKDRAAHKNITVEKIGAKKDKEFNTYVLKFVHPEMAYLEAVSNSFYRWLTPDVVSSSNAVYQGNKYIGVASRKEGFESFAKQFYSAPLSDEEIKRLAQMLIGSFLFKEDDLHKGNIGKKKRCDFDMSFFPILSQSKGVRFVDYIPGWARDIEKDFKITAKDICEFPDIGDNYCYYWVTKTGRASNNFSKEQNKIFCELKTNPIFVREKFKTMLKFLLIMNVGSSKALCDLHVKENTKLNGNLVVDLFVNQIESRREELRKVLIGMPEFEEFMEKDGQEAVEEIFEEVAIVNNKMQSKIKRGKEGYEKLILDINDLQQKYNKIKIEVQAKKVLGFEVDENNGQLNLKVSS